MGYTIYKSRRQSNDTVLMDITDVCATFNVVVAVDFATSSVTTREITISNGVITAVGEEV